jgi:hydrogenase expression/formation protein HypC
MCLGIPGEILSITPGAFPMARVSFGGAVREVCLVYVPEAVPGQYVIVHAGFAISRLDPEQARSVLTYLDTLDDESLPAGAPEPK